MQDDLRVIGHGRSMSKTIAVLLADDHALVREMLSQRLQQEPDISVLAQVENAQDAVRECARLKPGVVLLDIDMPGLSAFEAARAIKAESPSTRILFLSAFFHDQYIEQAMTVEADGYVTKNEPPESVLRALRAVSAGQVYFSAEVQARLVLDASGVRLADVPQTRMSLLTPREREILGYIARGLAKKEMARLAGISVKTVEQHCVHIMDKLDIHDRVESPASPSERVWSARDSVSCGRRAAPQHARWLLRALFSIRPKPTQTSFVCCRARKRPTAGSSAAFIAFWMPASRLSTHIGGTRGAARGA